MNLHAMARKMQTALSMRGRHIKINQYQSWSEKAERMVTKFVVCEKQMTEGKAKDTIICESYKMSDVVLALSRLLKDDGGGHEC